MNGFCRCAAIGVVGVIATATATAPAVGAPVSTPAKPSDTLADSVGVNTNLSNGDSGYCANYSAVKQALQHLGARYIRGGGVTINTLVNPCTPSLAVHQAYGDLATNGRRLMLLSGGIDKGSPSGDANTYQMAYDSLASLYLRIDRAAGDPNLPGALNDTLDYAELIGPSKLVGIEGPNEYNANTYLQTVGQCGATQSWAASYPWRSRLRTWFGWLFDAVNARPAIANVPVVGPSFSKECDAAAFMHQGFAPSPGFDAGNMHLYPNPGLTWEARVEQVNALFQQMAGGDPIVVTETGYSAATQAGSGPVISEEGRAKMLPRVFLENLRRGYQRTFWYQLLDGEPTNPADPEAAFGLINSSLVRQPSYYAMRQLIAATTDPGAPYSPGPLSYELTGNQSGVRSMLLGRRDGSHILAVWRDELVYNPVTKTDIAVAPRTLGLNLGGAGTYDVATLAPSDPAFRTDAATATWTPLASGVTTANLSVSGEALLVRVTPHV